MMTPRAPTRRCLWLVTVACMALALGVTAACVGDFTGVDPPGVDRPARAVMPGAPPSDMDAAAAELPTVDVAGRVVDDLDGPVVGRSVVLVDRRGARKELMTDEEGGFWAGAVAPPYDVLVQEAPSGPVITPLAFLGLRRTDPRLEVSERGGPAPRPPSQPVRVGVRLPPCRGDDAACWVSVVSASASGGGSVMGSYVGGTEHAVFELDHAWREPTTRPDESLVVHVLVGDAEYTQYAYERVSRIAAMPGEPTDLGVVVPARVESTEPVSIAARADAPLEGWQWTLASELELAGGAVMPLRFEWSPCSTMRVPVLPGAAWRVGAWAEHPPTPERAYFHRASQAWSGTLPLSTANVALAVPPPPEPLRPELEGTLSRRGRGLAWQGPSPALASIVLVDRARGRQRFRAFTAETELQLSRLEALGLARLEPGEHVLDMTTTPGAIVDELTDPDELGRNRRRDGGSAGATTYQRFRFIVTP